MSIDRLLNSRSVARKDAERLRQAFNLVLARLHLVDRDDPVCEIVASKVIEIGLNGAQNPQEIAELTIKRLGT